MENNDNLANLYPADEAYWRDIEIISVWDVVLLSLGIEPQIIFDLSGQNFVDGEADAIHYGQQDREYYRRRAALCNAIEARTVARVDTDNSRYKNHIRMTDFIAWAKGKGWSMPEWLSSIKAPEHAIVPASSVSGVREIKKAETQDQYRQWQSKAEKLRTDNPTWSMSHIAKVIANESDVAVNTVRNNIKIR